MPYEWVQTPTISPVPTRPAQYLIAITRGWFVVGGRYTVESFPTVLKSGSHEYSYWQYSPRHSLVNVLGIRPLIGLALPAFLGPCRGAEPNQRGERESHMVGNCTVSLTHAQWWDEAKPASRTDVRARKGLRGLRRSLPIDVTIFTERITRINLFK